MFTLAWTRVLPGRKPDNQYRLGRNDTVFLSLLSFRHCYSNLVEIKISNRKKPCLWWFCKIYWGPSTNKSWTFVILCTFYAVQYVDNFVSALVISGSTFSKTFPYAHLQYKKINPLPASLLLDPLKQNFYLWTYFIFGKNHQRQGGFSIEFFISIKSDNK
jgi:hypothetical protein